MQRSSCNWARGIRICASVEQQLHRVFEPSKDGLVQCREAIFVAIVDICVQIEKVPDAYDLALERSSQEREISWRCSKSVV
jgi:hypothetical protein